MPLIKRLCNAGLASLTDLQSAFPAAISEIRGRGFLRGICLAEGVDLMALVSALRGDQVLCVPAAENTLRLLPPLIISREEIVGEAGKAFAGYDTNNDGKLSQNELQGRGGSRSAMGGFIKGHAKEIDRDGDGVVSRDEVVNNAQRMFRKIDDNSDDVISPEELEASRRQ